jgi:transcriptional regulator with GAF, ATPase, and Fis domain
VRHMAATMDERLAETFVELADTLVAGYDLMEFLQTLTERCVELLEVNAAGLLLADAGSGLQVVAASAEQARLIELFQIQLNEGPCLDSYRAGQAVIVSDIRTEPDAARWPRFAAAAHAAGFAAVHAIPMRLRDEVIGTMNLFSTAPGGLAPAVARAARTLVDVATIGILQERSIRRGEVLNEQLQGALNSRAIIEQAKGVLAQHGGLSVDAAFDRLRRYSRHRNQRLSEVARRIVDGDLDPDAFTTPTQQR